MLDFGTGYDSFEDIAHSGAEVEMVKKGKLSLGAYINRELLYYVMGKNGMLPYAYEWWHFQLTYQESDKLKYKLLDF
jgi:D-alanyl-D-alanine dipeptidase